MHIRENYAPDDIGIVYCMTKSDSEDVANFLFSKGLKADYYHAGNCSIDVIFF